MSQAPDEARLRTLIEAAGLTVRPSELPRVLETARFLLRAADKVRSGS